MIPTTKETLKMCKVIVDGLAVGAMNGISYHPQSMVELSGYIAVAIERESHKVSAQEQAAIEAAEREANSA